MLLTPEIVNEDRLSLGNVFQFSFSFHSRAGDVSERAATPEIIKQFSIIDPIVARRQYAVELI